jgi:hypothetical protein
MSKSEISRTDNLLPNNPAAYRDGDKIIDFLINRESAVSLSDKEKEKLERLFWINQELFRFKKRSEIKDLYMVKYPCTSMQTAYREINEAMYVFGAAHRLDKKYEQHFLTEISRENIKIAFATKDNKKISEALKVHMEITGVNREELEAFDFDKIASNITLNVDVKVLNQIQNMLSPGVVDLDKILEFPSAEDNSDER